MHVLIADDDLTFLDSLAELLRASGLDVETATDGVEALQQVAGSDVLLTDVWLPKLDGLALGQQAQAANAALRVIVMTGYDSPTVRQEAIAFGASGYFVKPFPPQTLIDLLRSFQVAVASDLGATAVADRRLLDPAPGGDPVVGGGQRRPSATVATAVPAESAERDSRRSATPGAAEAPGSGSCEE